MQRPYRFLKLACVALVSLGVSVAECAEDSAVHQREIDAIRAAAKDYLAAMRRGDFEAMHKMWTPDGDYIDAAGQVFKVHDLMRRQATTRQSGGATTEVPLPESTLRFITPDVAIEDGSTEYGTRSDGRVETGRFTAVWVKRDGRWLLDSLREATTSSQPVNANLLPLEWLIGEWVGTTDNSAIFVSSRWSEGGSYIVREFLVRSDDGEVVTGTEHIGWEPIAGQIKSWTFDSQGGVGEGRWRRDGNRWRVDSADATADGKKSKTSAVYAPGDDGRFVWEVTDAKLEGMGMPPSRVEFKRAVENE